MTTKLRTSLVTQQPGKAIWTIAAALAFVLLQLPFWLVYYLPRRLRQHPQWTYRQAIMNEVVRVILYHSSHVEVYTPIQLDEKDERFVRINPPTEGENRNIIYHGLLDDPEVQPVVTGGTWYPRTYQREDDEQNQTVVVLHLHGGAYTLNQGRPEDIDFLATTLVENLDAEKNRRTKALLLSYRLSSNEDCNFPAALQDAVTAYYYLVENQKIPPSRIVLSGDSAGGGLAVSLLRHIHSTDEKYINNIKISSLLPPPSAALLFSPWLDLKSARNPGYVLNNKNRKTDYIPSNFVAWGARTYIAAHLNLNNPNFSPLQHPFRTNTPLWIHIGGLEVLCDEGIRFATVMRDNEEENAEGKRKKRQNRVEVYVEPLANHDILLVGHKTGFAAEAKKAVRVAGEFVRRCGVGVQVSSVV